MTDEEGKKDDQTKNSEQDQESRNLREELGGGPIDSIDDLPETLKDQIERDRRRAVTKAREKWEAENKGGGDQDRRQDDKSQNRDRKSKEEPITRAELLELFRQERLTAERDRRAEQLVDQTLRNAGVPTEGPEFQKLNDVYYKGIDEGLWDKSVLATEAGIRSLMMHAGLGLPDQGQNPNRSYEGDGLDELNKGAEKYLYEETKERAGINDAEANAHVAKALRDEGIFHMD